MLQPKRMKFRKMHKGRNRGFAAGSTVAFGTYGLKAVGRGRMTARQIEAARRAMTEKPLEVRQGKGKGNVEYWVCQIQPGRVLYEMEGVPENLAREAFELAAAKLPFKTTFVTRTVM